MELSRVIALRVDDISDLFFDVLVILKNPVDQLKLSGVCPMDGHARQG